MDTSLAEWGWKGNGVSTDDIPLDFADSVSAAWDLYSGPRNTIAFERELGPAYLDNLQNIYEATGNEAFNPREARQKCGINPFTMGAHTAAENILTPGRREMLLEHHRALDPAISSLGNPEYETSDQINSRLAAKTVELEMRASQGGFLGSLVGGAGASMLTDPVNMATLPIGATSGMGFLASVLAEAGGNVLAEAVAQPFISDYYKAIGLTRTREQILEDIKGAALGGAGFGAVGQVATKLFNKAVSVGRARYDSRAGQASRAVESALAADQASPAPAGSAASMLHLKQTQAATRQLAGGAAVTAELTPEAQTAHLPELLARGVGVADTAGTELLRGRLEARPTDELLELARGAGLDPALYGTRRGLVNGIVEHANIQHASGTVRA